MGWGIFFLILIAMAITQWRWKAVAVLFCLYLLYPFSFWSYKLTLVVETPEGIKTGSAVRWVYFSVMPKLLPEEHGVDFGVKGEAVAVDLGKRGLLFALMKGTDAGGDAYYIVEQTFPHQGGVRGKVLYYTFLKDKKELAFDKIPMLVRFRDINDPKTVEQVDPNDLGKSFGEGVRLVSATLEMTNEDMTQKIANILPSWKNTGFAEWRAKLRYDQVIIDREDFERN